MKNASGHEGTSREGNDPADSFLYLAIKNDTNAMPLGFRQVLAGLGNAKRQRNTVK